ncbi:MAG: hypothetical protein NWP82_06010 [Flavobacteriales bacterium]|jgi:hypothetical protein|nr:hypothetical protein [Flavobacteriales bacterium]MDP4717697.1 hypothetical protein [Flavobacteriales bacterium]MDP4731577.1 hypothetical protein [Flavobacteriales bacterium]MDP4818591.1 hypothetical protein [Flavobacteriales bacterium]MDP5076020.1 hypothetical protein [Flavobacteriales bacterium]
MKKVILTLFIAAHAFAMNAQKSAIDIVADAACDCINNSELHEIMSRQDAELFLGQCMAPSIMENMEALMKELKLTEFNQQSGYQIGIEVGKKLSAMCPKFIELSLLIARNTNNEVPVDEEYNESESEAVVESEYENDEIGVIQGRFVREEGGAQRYIVINVDGLEEKFLWLYWFDGADDLFADPSFYLNREVYVEYVSFEMFDGISRSYVPVKVLVSLLGNE